MIEPLLKETADQFWHAAGISPTFPRELERAVAWVMPIAILKIPNLWTRDVEDCLRRRQLPLLSVTEDRPLHGCVYAYAGKGLIIVNGTDEIDELRFTIAHELAHFLLNYQVPRNRAIDKLGPEITDVLDGLRAARTIERVDAVLSGVLLGIYSHFMHREDVKDGSTIVAAESRADRLAVELLAPEEAVRRLLPRGFYDRTFQRRVGSLRRLLKMRFGLPRSVAASLASRICREWFGGPSAREWLGL
jgi:hypothetical protein